MLWLSKFACLNDVSEQFNWMRPDFYRALIKDRQDRRLLEEEEIDLKLECSKFDGYLPLSLLEGKECYGIVSFCEKNNKQIMWGHYANGLNGICVGLNLHEDLWGVKNKIKYGEYLGRSGEFRAVYMFQPVCYDHNAPQIWQNGIFPHYQAEYDNILKESPEIKKMSLNAAGLALLNSIAEKSPCWRDEDEVKLFLTGHNKIQLEKFIDPIDGEPNLSLVFLLYQRG